LDLNAIATDYRLSSEEQNDNRDAARGQDDPDNAFQRYESWGRVGGWDVEFSHGENLITSSVSIYESESGASDSFRWGASSYAEWIEELNTIGKEGITVLLAEILDGPELADDSIASRIRGSQLYFGTQQHYELITIFFRVANVGGRVDWGSHNTTALVSDVEELARKQIERIRMAIESQQNVSPSR